MLQHAEKNRELTSPGKGDLRPMSKEEGRQKMKEKEERRGGHRGRRDQDPLESNGCAERTPTTTWRDSALQEETTQNSRKRVITTRICRGGRGGREYRGRESL